MQDWFGVIGAGRELPAGALEDLRDVGFVVIPGPVASDGLASLAATYDSAVASASPEDVGVGSTTTRVHDFVNRGADFDELYVHRPAYISPALYEEWVSVPTWNYAVVHAYGKVSLNDDVEAVLEKMIGAFDADYLTRWSALPEEYRSKLKAGIVGFEVDVERVEAKFKMHQGKSRADRLRIIEEFGGSGDTTLAGVAEYMRRSLSSEGET